MVTKCMEPFEIKVVTSSTVTANHKPNCRRSKVPLLVKAQNSWNEKQDKA